MRVIFLKKEQRKFLNKIFEKISITETAELCNLSERTIRDWRREKFSIDLISLNKLCRKTKIAFPSNVKLKDDYWYVLRGSSVGGKVVLKRYGKIGGNEKHRKKKWREWWEKVGKFNLPKCFIAKEINVPQKDTELAEFVGIMIGDGGITKNQVVITLNAKNDRSYSLFVKKIIKKLFNEEPSIFTREDESVINIVVSRVRLVSFCKSIGLKVGDKLRQNLDIPNWIKMNKEYAVACVRGLVDTDGCVFSHCYKINGRTYCYKKISFTSYSYSLICSVFYILKRIGIKSRITHNKKELWIDSQENVKKYFNYIGFHNLKHLKKYEK
jgi:ribosomal protein L39E